MSERGRDSYSIQSVENALDLLEALCEEGDEVRISHLSEKLGMHKTSVFRLLATFESRGYVEREKASGKYRLGLSAYEMGQKFLSRMNLLQKARPVMERLAREFNEAVYLVVRRREEILFLDMVDTAHQVKIISLVGRRFPLLGTSAGKIFLAHGPLSATSPAEGINGDLRQDLLQIRQKGFQIDRDVLGEGIVSASVPLFAATGELSGCLCLVGPDFRVSPEIIEKDMLPGLKDAAVIISSKLGHLHKYLQKERL